MLFSYHLAFLLKLDQFSCNTKKDNNTSYTNAAMNQRQDTDGVCSGLLCLWVVALVAPVDQLSPGAGLVVPHHLTIVLLMRTLILTLGRTRKFIPPPWYKGETRVDGTRPRGFDMLEYSETILPSAESLWSSLQDKVYFMGGGAAGGMWCHQQWSQSRPPS